MISEEKEAIGLGTWLHKGVGKNTWKKRREEDIKRIRARMNEETREEKQE